MPRLPPRATYQGVAGAGSGIVTYRGATISHKELELIERFFAAYTARDLDALRRVLADEATWTFPGHYRLSGTHTGVEAIVTVFDAMGVAIALRASFANGAAGPTVERLVTGVGDGCVIECQHVQTGRSDGTNLNQRLAVLWTITRRRIVAGQHLVADHDALDRFFATEG